MSNARALRLPYTPTHLAAGLVGALVLVYLALIAVVMSYAALTVEFSQSVRNDEARVATLEARYLDRVAEISTLDYVSAGYTKPLAQIFVATKSGTALR